MAQDPPSALTVEERVLVPRAFDEYTWDELSQVSLLIEEAPDDDAARAVASQYGLLDENGLVTTQTRTMTLQNGQVCEVRVVGMLHDLRADGEGRAGLSLMAGPMDVRPMNDAPVAAGGWEGSSLRTWLSSDGLALLPGELSSLVVPVLKPTNNVGVTNTTESVTMTEDLLWPFSAREVAGDIDWFRGEFGSGFSYLDAVLNAEGEQYEAFSQAGVASGTDPNHVLARTWQGEACPWWYRTPYPLDVEGLDSGVFYQVLGSGFPSSVGQADVPAGVVVGFCL